VSGLIQKKIPSDGHSQPSMMENTHRRNLIPTIEPFDVCIDVSKNI
jgi:hypothetical protein